MIRYFHEVIEEEEKILNIGLKQSRLNKAERQELTLEQEVEKWIGCMEETIFEINMVSIDENTVLSLNYSKEIHNQLKSVGIEPIYTKFRHRYFWDGGLNCLTLDTRREGGCESYSL